MEKLTELFTSPVVSGIGWTLIHATWQITILVLAYVGVKFLTRKSDIRYWTGIGLLFAQIPISIVTFFVVYTPSSIPNSISDSLEIALQLSLSERITTYLNTHINLIFGLWFVGILLLFFKLGTNFYLTNKLKNSKLHKYNSELIAILSDVRVKLGVTRKIEIYEAKAVTIPMVIGILKPVILIPATVLSGLSAEQLEIIIAHELAHLKRYDFTLNILQSFVEIVFFYHPAFWFLSAEIRQEREHCCDETAMQVNDDRLLLVKTLTSIQVSTKTLPLVMAFGRKKMSLLERVQHILGVNQKRSHTKESLWLLGGLMVVFMAFAQGENPKSSADKNGVDNLIAQLDNSSISTTELEVNAVGLAGVDTTIVTEQYDSSSKIQMWGDKHKVIIDGERIVIDGKEQQLTPEQKQILRKNYAALKASEGKMQVHVREIEAKAAEMEKYAQQIEIDIKPMEAVAQQMEMVGRQMETIAQKYEPKLSGKNTTIGEIEEISKKMEREMKVYEVQMRELDKQMEAVGIEIDKNVEVQMRAIEKQMQIHEAPIEKYGEEMESYMEEIKKLIPADIIKDFERNTHFGDAPTPPRPPKPVRPVKPLKGVNPPPPPAPAPPVPASPKPPKYDYEKLGLSKQPFSYLPIKRGEGC